ncbi:TldD/PmbA family protein [Chromobacterium sp. IIBBL 290-4]|uniref:TldD/PmbA family protein n=1 Tax=Chromobacterium sp. IIBBL 290-4 TaxID=2953890 RepID=UPI0020B80FDB|nr:TldD/PmbA family protein [Chromobacterium sp. IIBBL 290-4]UTH73557.1 TldD/PmbA family protein [Chromobacterium sp. IIBBL 290-4]
MFETIRRRFQALQTQVDFCSLRYVEEDSESLSVRQGRQQPLVRRLDRGAMIAVADGGGYGYAATADLSEAGLRAAFERARDWARATAGHGVFDYRRIDLPSPKGQYRGAGTDVAAEWPRAALLDLLLSESAAAKGEDGRIVDWSAGLYKQDIRQLYLTSAGGEAEQHLRALTPSLSVTAFDKGLVQTRSLGRSSAQGGLEMIAESGLRGAGRKVADEALQLLAAPNCPSDKRDLLLMPDQMMLQIHESIGHPLELDRILGDERNYAGTSFVTLDMFGSYRYGSDLLNVTFDPLLRNELASYGWDDDGKTADKAWLIRNGILERPLGGDISAARAGLDGFALDGVANSRACNWNRAPIDRMANLNVEPGDQSLAQLIAGIERGVLMRTNVSWSIDDSRNKFQFGCEWGQLIENGELRGVVRNPNYRGVSANFWRSLKAVGDASTFEVMGTPYCGKGEPNQMVRVGHASPACVFGEVEVFGGAA